MVMTLVPINMESMAAPWERSFTNYRRAGLLLPLMSSTRLFSPKSPRSFLTSLLDRFLVCYLIRVTVTIPESSFHGHFPLFRNCRGTRPWVCFYYLLLAFTQRPAGPRIHPIATPLAGPNLLIPKTESFCHLFEVLLVYKTWFWLDAVKKSTVVGGTQVSNATKYAMTRYVDTIDRTQGHNNTCPTTHGLQPPQFWV
jgi:hypothetical protein